MATAVFVAVDAAVTTACADEERTADVNEFAEPAVAATKATWPDSNVAAEDAFARMPCSFAGLRVLAKSR